MVNETQMLISRFVTKVAEAKDNMSYAMLEGNLEDFEDYKYVTGQFRAWTDAEIILNQEYGKLVKELYGNEGDTDGQEENPIR
jgi:hypothetical protein